MFSIVSGQRRYQPRDQAVRYSPSRRCQRREHPVQRQSLRAEQAEREDCCSRGVQPHTAMCLVRPAVRRPGDCHPRSGLLPRNLCGPLTSLAGIRERTPPSVSYRARTRYIIACGRATAYLRLRLVLETLGARNRGLVSLHGRLGLLGE